MEKLKVLSLFSGIGAFEHALNPATANTAALASTNFL